MRVSPNQLIPGCMITEDIIGKTNHIIIAKNTVINSNHILVLKRFLIDKVQVSNKLMSGELFVPQEEIEEEEETIEPIYPSFLDVYLQAVVEYKKMFKNWQSGSPVLINEVRKFFLPLIEKVLESSYDIFLLHHYSTKEDYLYHHSIAVGLISAFIANRIPVYKKDAIQIGLAGFLSDCGMARIDESILHKETSLTQKEYEEVRKHPTYSYRMIEKISVLKDEAKVGILQHHERLDGSGYPMGVTDKRFPPYGRIIAISDMYHAMTSERIYRRKTSPFKVVEEIMQGQFGKFDHKIVRTFVDSLTNYSTGTRVRLSNGLKGEIIFIEDSSPTRPMIRLEDGEIIHLKMIHDIYIEEILNVT
ncbi:HD-GYP domain-containing protein [Bacillaceae bacterium S4-13-58]